MASILFILTFLASIILFFSTFYFLMRKDSRKACYSTISLVLLLVCYLGILLGFSLTSKTIILPINKDKCFDDWCASVNSIRELSSQRYNTYAVTLLISNHALGRAQRPDHPEVYVVDSNGNRYEISALEQTNYEKKLGKQRNLDSLIDPGSSYFTTKLFTVPIGRKGFVVIEEGGFPTPLIIGDEGSLFHKKSMTNLN